MPPVVARDTQILEEILPGSDNDDGNMTSNHRGDTTSRSVFHISIPPRRPSPASCSCLRQPSALFTRQIEPILSNMIQYYLAHLHPCLPILDPTTIHTQLTTSTPYPQTFLTNFAAYVLFYWRSSSPTARPPDQDFAWQVACSAMGADMQTSGVPAIQAAALCVAGRPSKGVVHNTVNVARIVTLSHTIGLNHDCARWKLDDSEKQTRWKLWWVVLVHDRWFHFAQGTPPLVSAAHYDVPLPTRALLLAGGDDDERSRSAADCYVALCRLTEIVGDVLPLVYHVRAGTKESVRGQQRKSQSDLDEWCHSLVDSVDLDCFENRPDVPGLVNLQLSYLVTQMLLERLAWYEENHSSKLDDGETKLRKCLAAAQKFVRFALSLTECELAGFWLPYNTQHFTSATTLLLRCALQTRDEAVRKQCMKLSCDLVDALQRYQSSFNWDLAEIALPTSVKLLSRVQSALPTLSASRSKQPASSNISGVLNNNVASWHHISRLHNLEISDLSLLDHYEASLEQLFPDLFRSLIDYPVFE